MTARVLICFHSGEGQSTKIVDRIRDVLEGAGAAVVVSTAEDDPCTEGFDGVVVGDSIHLGKHSRQLKRWISRHGSELDALPVALFQVSLTSADHDEEHTAEAHKLVADLLDATGLDPDLVAMFAGSIAFTRYGWLKRRMMAKIAAERSGGAEADTSRDLEYTDWDDVEHFARDALAMIRTGGTREP